MNCIVYVRHSEDISLYTQFNKCAEYAKQYGYSIAGKVFDFDGKHLHEAINKVIANSEITILMIYSKEVVFPKYNDYLFFRIYLEKLGKKLVSCN